MGGTSVQLPIGCQVSLPGHYDKPVVLESARSLGKGFECRVRLHDGTLHEAVISAGAEQSALGKLLTNSSAVMEGKPTTEDYQFLTAAVPELAIWEQRSRSGTPTPEPAPAPSRTLQQLWQRFLEQRESIMVHKWLESQKAAHDIGIERAIRDWLTLISR